jgi:hypothetical protein
MGYKQGMKVKKSFKHPPYFWLPNREICGDFRILATREPLKKHNFLSLFEFSHPKNRNPNWWSKWQREIGEGRWSSYQCVSSKVEKKKNPGI